VQAEQAAGLGLCFCHRQQPAGAEPGPRLPRPAETGRFQPPALQSVSSDDSAQPLNLTGKEALNAEVKIMLSDCFLVIFSLGTYTKALCPQVKRVPLQMCRNTSLAAMEK